MTAILFQVFKQPSRGSVPVSYSDFLSMVEGESVIQVTIQGDNISGMSAQGPFKTFAPKDPELIKLLRSKGVKISAKPEDDSPWFHVLLGWFPMLLLIGVWVFFMRQMQQGGGKILSFGKSLGLNTRDVKFDGNIWRNTGQQVTLVLEKNKKCAIVKLVLRRLDDRGGRWVAHLKFLNLLTCPQCRFLVGKGREPSPDLQIVCEGQIPVLASFSLTSFFTSVRWLENFHVVTSQEKNPGAG